MAINHPVNLYQMKTELIWLRSPRRRHLLTADTQHQHSAVSYLNKRSCHRQQSVAHFISLWLCVTIILSDHFSPWIQRTSCDPSTHTEPFEDFIAMS